MAEGRRAEEARRWFLQARHDLQAAAWNVQGGFNDTACFLAQQAVEKALKSLHYDLGSARKILLTHSVVLLLEKATKKVPELGTCLESGRELDLHYVPSRYPNGLPSGYPHRFYGKETAERALGCARAILTIVESHYGDRVREWESEE
jgi:HEPN domain-containing protein